MRFLLDDRWPQALGIFPYEDFETPCYECGSLAIACRIHPDGDFVVGCRDCLAASAHPDREKAWQYWLERRRPPTDILRQRSECYAAALESGALLRFGAEERPIRHGGHDMRYPTAELNEKACREIWAIRRMESDLTNPGADQSEPPAVFGGPIQ